MGVGLVVEGRHLPVAGRPVQAECLAQGTMGFQLDRADAMGRGLGLKFGQEPPSQAEPAGRRGDPHPLDVSRVLVELEHPAPDRLGVQGGEQEQPRGRGHLVVGGGDAPGRIEPFLEAVRQLGDVGMDCPAGVRVPGVTHADPDRRGHQEPLDLGHRRYQPLPLPLAERVEDGGGRVVGEPVEFGSFGAPAAGQAGCPYPAVRVARLDDDHPVALQRAQQAAQVAGVQVEPGPQQPEVAALGTDLPQQARLPEGSAAGQERLVQRADSLRDDPVEPPDLLDHPSIHSLTLVREWAPAKARVGTGAR